MSALQEFLEHVARGETIEAGSAQHAFMHGRAQTALQIVAELNGSYRSPEQVRELLGELTGRPVDASVTLSPPFY